MQTRLVDKPAFILAGLAVDTSQAHQAADATPLATRFFAPGFMAGLRGRTDPTATVALHANWNPDDETYRLMFGCEVEGADQPDGVEVVRIPAARYTLFTAVGPQPQASIDAWKEITAWRGRPDLVRTGPVSFEIHDARARGALPEVDIYIPAIPA
jgi:predicted transcriptional regulator YdeE